jgi:hypothetical protein
MATHLELPQELPTPPIGGCGALGCRGCWASDAPEDDACTCFEEALLREALERRARSCP